MANPNSDNTNKTNKYLYPAFLSHVAAAFRVRVPLGSHVRDGIEYRSCFLGSEAVDTIAFVVNSPDRNLALVIGRSLDSQAFISSASSNSNARLKDSSDLYKLYDDPNCILENDFQSLFTADDKSGSKKQAEFLERSPVGFFLLLSDCYSPTCSMEDLCYSVSCPRKLYQIAFKAQQADAASSLGSQQEQNAQKKLEEDLWWSNTVPKEVLDSVSKEEEKRQNAIYDMIKTEKNYVDELKIIQSLYANPLRESSVIEKPRLDIFMKSVFSNAADLLTVNQKLLNRLLARQKETIIVEKIGDIFYNIASELVVYVEYCENREYSRNDIAFEKSQNPKFKEFLAKAILKSEVRAETKHELDGYLHKPIARMASYLLLLRAIFEKTPTEHPDKILIPQAIKAIEVVLSQMNAASGKTITKIKLMQLSQQIIPTDDFDLKLMNPERQIIYEGKLVLKRSTGDISLVVFLFDHVLVMTRKSTDKKIDAAKYKGSRYKIYKLPILYELIAPVVEVKRAPLALPRVRTDYSSRPASTISPSIAGLKISSTSPPTSLNPSQNLPQPISAAISTSSSIAASIVSAPPASTSLQPLQSSTPPSTENKLQFSITVVGRDIGGTYTFQCDTESGRNIWREHITKIRSKKLLASMFFEIKHKLIDCWTLGSHGTISSRAVSTAQQQQQQQKIPASSVAISVSGVSSRFQCACEVRGRLVFATEVGLFAGPSGSSEKPGDYIDGYVMILAMEKITQVDCVLEHGILLVLADKILLSYDISILDTYNPSATNAAGGSGDDARKPKKIGEAINFFKVGWSNNRTLVCTVRASQLSSTIKIFESVEISTIRRKGRINLFSRNSYDGMKLFKEFYIPTEASSIHILKTKLCVGCTKGFEIVDLETLETQALLDPSDESLDFVLAREDMKPMSVFKITDSEYLLCYDEFGFFVDRMGRRTRESQIMNWFGVPTAFAYISPYILSFDASFIEIRNTDSGDLSQIVYANSIKVLHIGRTFILGSSLQSGDDRQSMFQIRSLDSNELDENSRQSCSSDDGAGGGRSSVGSRQSAGVAASAAVGDTPSVIIGQLTSTVEDAVLEEEEEEEADVVVRLVVAAKQEQEQKHQNVVGVVVDEEDNNMEDSGMAVAGGTSETTEES